MNSLHVISKHPTLRACYKDRVDEMSLLRLGDNFPVLGENSPYLELGNEKGQNFIGNGVS